jgi:hypothetical protein
MREDANREEETRMSTAAAWRPCPCLIPAFEELPVSLPFGEGAKDRQLDSLAAKCADRAKGPHKQPEKRD